MLCHEAKQYLTLLQRSSGHSWSPSAYRRCSWCTDIWASRASQKGSWGLRQSGSLTLASMAQCLLLLLPRRGFLLHSVCGKNTWDGNRGNSWQKWTVSSESVVGSQLRAIYSDLPNPLNVDVLIHKCEIIQSFVPSLVCISFPIKGCVTNKIRAILKIRLQN